MFSEFSSSQLLILAALVFFAGVVDALAGGGGLITLPAYLAFGLSPALLLGTNKLSSCLGTAVAAYKFVRKTRFGADFLFILVVLAAAGAALGAAACLLVALIAASVLAPPWPLLCGLAAAAYYGLFAPPAFLLAECLFSSLLALSFLALHRKRAFLFGMALAAVFLVRPEVLLFAGLAILVLPFLPGGGGRKGAAAAALGGLLSSQLFGVTPTDPLTYAGVAALFLVVAVVATAIAAGTAGAVAAAHTDAGPIVVIAFRNARTGRVRVEGAAAGRCAQIRRPAE